MQKHIHKYIAHLHAQPAHHRRRFSMQASAVITLVVFFLWLSTLGMRLASSSIPPPQSSQTAAALTAVGSDMQSEDTSGQFTPISAPQDAAPSAGDSSVYPN